jgi:hypothetical protein
LRSGETPLPQVGSSLVREAHWAGIKMLQFGLNPDDSGSLAQRDDWMSITAL